MKYTLNNYLIWVKKIENVLSSFILLKADFSYLGQSKFERHIAIKAILKIKVKF